MKPVEGKLIFGNWKMQLTVAQAVKLAEALKAHKSSVKLMVGVFPSFDALESVHKALAGSAIVLGAQDCYWEDKGAFTGEESPAQLIAAGCTHVLVGHSERRITLNESDEMINKKLHATLIAGLVPVLCVGEQAAERASGAWAGVLERQLKTALAGVSMSGTERVVIAYEPVWAIGTGTACDPSDAREAHEHIRGTLADLTSKAHVAQHYRVIYGGSVDAKNVASYLAEKGIDGALVGGASQKASSFTALLDAAAR